MDDITDDPKIIDLHRLENLPQELFEEIIGRLEPKSLVKICQASKEIRQRCKGAWRRRFKEDISSDLVCKDPNWEKLYRLALTRTVDVYNVSLFDFDDQDMVESEVERHALGKDDLKEIMEVILRTDLDLEKKEVSEFMKKHPPKEAEYDIDDEYILRIMTIGSVPLLDVFRSDPEDDAELFEMRIRLGRRELSFTALGFDGLLRRVQEALQERGFDKESIEDLQESISETYIEHGLDALKADLFEIHGTVSTAEIKIVMLAMIDPTSLQKIRESICKMK